MSKYQITTDKGVYEIETSSSSEINLPTDSVLPGEQKVEGLMRKRRDSVDVLKEEVNTPFDYQHPFKSIGRKTVLTGMKAIGVPLQRIESGVAGVGLGLQKGSLKEGLIRGKQGLLGQKKQELGDIVRNISGVKGLEQLSPIPRIAGSILSNKSFNEPLAQGIGFTASLVAPVKIIKDTVKSLSKIEKFSDKGLKLAGQKLIQGSDEAVKTIGSQVDEAYKPINKISVNANDIIDDVAKLPKPLISYIEEKLGQNLDDYMQDFNIEKARKLKSLVGKFRPSVFDKRALGLDETISGEKINKAYSTIKKTMQSHLNKSGLKERSNNLLDADEAFTETMRASDFIRKSVVDKTLKLPTKLSGIASKLEDAGDLSAREALNILRDAGGSARNNINKAILELEKYNKYKKVTGILGRAAGAAVYGGVAGQAAGKIMQGANE